MAITTNKDKETGLEVNGLYYTIDRISLNERDFQVIVSVYASEEAYRAPGRRSLRPASTYTLQDFDVEQLASMNIYAFAYDYLKSQDAFTEAEDVFEDGQLETLEAREKIESQVIEEMETSEN